MTVIATAGHVDHGKSSLIRAMTGTDPDRLAEEQRTGMTIDLGFAHVVGPGGTSLSFIDVPGHIDFIRTMISGVSGVDVALLVVDANEGWKPQTEEHLGILEVLGVRHGVVAITKSDKVDDARLTQLSRSVAERLRHSPVQWAGTVPTSVVTGFGLASLVAALEQTVRIAGAATHGRARLFLDRVFTIRGAGTVVTGTLDGADVTVGDTLVVARTGREVRVRDIQVHNTNVTACAPGSRCALNIVGADVPDLNRGDALVAPGRWLTTTVFDGSFTALPGLAKPVTHRGSFILHVGSSSQTATLRVAGNGTIEPGATGTVRVRFTGSLPLTPGDRYLIRETGIGTTIGGGTVANVDPQGKVADATSDSSVGSIMAGRGFVPVEMARLLTGVDLEPTIGGWFALESDLAAVTTSLVARLDDGGSIDLSSLSPHERDVIVMLPGVSIDNGVARRGGDDPLASHPYVSLIREAGTTPPDSKTFDRNVMRQLIQRGILYEHDHIPFHVDTLRSTTPVLERLWGDNPSGFTVSQLRESLGITRKHAVPLAECLDKAGLTRRVDDRRVPGPRA